jgi:hypothetical protein
MNAMGNLCVLADRLVQLDDDLHGLLLKVRRQIDNAADPRLAWLDPRLAHIVDLANHVARRAKALAAYELMAEQELEQEEDASNQEAAP